MQEIPYGNPGVASFASDSYGGTELLSGDVALTTTNESVAESTTLEVFAVVGRAANAPDGALVMATATGAPAIKPIGILTAAVTTGAGVTATVDVFRSGMFNPTALVWDASFNTDALKKAAFEGSVSPNIFIQKLAYQDTFTS